ncbi:MAG: flavin reductase [Nitriliruptoraceae bacterium]|nr:flavin reductase [Nitriliruptoraceae bacterium]
MTEQHANAAASTSGAGSSGGEVPVWSGGVDPDAFREALGSFPTGVSVMTTVHEGQPHGMTANALCSVSLDPPLVLVCVDDTAVMAGEVAASGRFALNVLADDQQALSDHFADPARPAGDAGFAGIAVTTAVTGAAILEGAVAWVDCAVTQRVDAGDHVVVIGKVLAAGASDRRPLLYHRGAYGLVPPATP